MEQTEISIDSILQFVEEKYGYDFLNYSRASLQRRINRFLTIKDIKSLEDLNIYLQSESNFPGFLEEITVNVTEMFRDPEFFAILRQKVIPVLATYPYIKIWVAGCSSGEEAYSLSIILKEEGLYEKSRIYATDINPRVLRQATEGIYNLSCIKDYTINYLRSEGKGQFSDYYLARYNKAIFDSELKKNIIFSVHNLASDSSFNEFNLILCRNVLIYFNKTLQDRAIKLFAESSAPLGYLALGTKETLTLSDYRDHFETTERNTRIYRRKY